MRRCRAAVSLASLALLAAGCRGGEPARVEEAPAGAAATPAPGEDGARVRFVEVAAPSGIVFQHVSGDPHHKRAIYETVSGGLAWLDADGDGWLDLYISNGGHRLRATPPPDAERTSGALFRNQGDGTFRDITREAGLLDWRWGVGASVGDYDNDGDPDLYVTHLGPNALWRNDGGRFTDVAAVADVDDDGPGTGSAFGDIDADGDLDLYVANYVPVAPDRPLPANDELCTYRSIPVYCGPRGLPAAPDVLYRNRGDGTFEDVTQAAGVALSSPRHSYDVLFLDVDRDRDADLYVAVDQMPSLLFVNDGKGRFSERGIAAGVALGEAGMAQAGMGADAADLDGDGLPEIVKTNFESEANNLYFNSPSGLFSDRAYAAGLSGTLSSLGWGVVFFDADRDGHLDLFFANGHVYPEVEVGLQIDYRQANLLYLGARREGRPFFTDWSGRAGPGLALKRVNRGVAVADYDADGDEDLAILALGEQPLLLRNDSPGAAHWLGVRLEGVRVNRDGYGALVELTAGGERRVREVRASRGFLSSSDPTVHFGLGAARRVEDLIVDWPGGRRERFRVDGIDRRVRLREGEGSPLE